MNLDQFKKHIRMVDHATLDWYHGKLTVKLNRARNPQIKTGYALALDALASELQLQRHGHSETLRNGKKG